MISPRTVRLLLALLTSKRPTHSVCFTGHVTEAHSILAVVTTAPRSQPTAPWSWALSELFRPLRARLPCAGRPGPVPICFLNYPETQTMPLRMYLQMALLLSAIH